MSIKAIVVALLALLVAICAAFYLTRGPATPSAAPAPLLAFDPAQVIGIEVMLATSSTNPAPRPQRVTRTDPGEWRSLWSADNSVRGGRVIEWPALVPPDALAAIAKLANLARAPGDSGAAPPSALAPAATLRLEIRGGTSHTVEFLPGSLGGFTLVRIPPSATGVGGGLGRIETAAAQALLNPGPASWRTRLAAPGARDASRVTLTDAAGEISLARLDARWTMRRPIAARADQGAVGALLGALASAPVERFENQSATDLAATGLDKPALTITWEADEREVVPSSAGTTQGADVRVRTRAGFLRIGGPANPQGTLRFASADEAGATLMVIPASALSSISTASRNYLAPTITGLRPDDVFLLTISEAGRSPASTTGVRAYRRRLDAWVSQTPAGAGAPADADALEQLLEFLASRPGEPEPTMGGVGEGDIREIVRVDLFDLDGDPLEILIGGYNADGALAFRAQNLVVLFPGIEPPAILDMPAFASLPALPDAQAPVKLPEGAPVGK